MKKICLAFCSDGIFPHAVGGMQRHSRLLIEYLSEFNDLEIHVIHPHTEKIFAKYQTVKEYFVPDIDTSKTYLIECYKYSKRVIDTITTINPDVIYSQGLSVWSNIKKVTDKLIVNPHGLDPYQGILLKDKLMGLPFRWVFNYIFRNSKYVVSLGGKLTHIIDRILRNSKTRCVVLANAVEIPKEKETGFQSDKTIFLFVGRFAYNKGIHVLMNVIEQLNADGFEQKAIFKFIGNGPLFDRFKTQNKNSNVAFLGLITDNDELDKQYRECDILVLPTLYEGMPTVVLEAMARKKPAIVTDIGAAAELVSSENGYLIEPGDEQQLKQAIIDFIATDTNERIKMGKRSFEIVNPDFTWESIALKHYNLFKSVAG